MPMVLIAPALFLALVFAAHAMGVIPGFVPVAYICLSLITFAAYAYDKSAAQRGRWRLSERSLLVLDFAGGWPGGCAAQQLMRHKTSKHAYQLRFWTVATVNAALLVLRPIPI